MMRVFLALLTAVALLESVPASANEFCDKELRPMVDQRKELSAKLAAINKRAKNPGARDEFCGTLRRYISNNRNFVSYMEKNKDFCAIPDQAITQARQGLAQSESVRKKICVASARPQAQEGGAPGKPALPRPPVELRLQ
jgi:hypothetical protein